MEEDQELKHVCKLCNKAFPCGRSLGGHMRSHVINSAETDENPKKYKLSSLKNGGSNSFIDNGYGLRENPKKSSRFVNSKEDTFLQGKLCKECGKGFQSWKALFGHMKCHSEKASNSTVEEDSWTSANNHSQSDNETGAPNRRKRSLRRFKRYLATTTTSSSFTIVNVSPSVSEIEPEQEEVARCLMMLSKDMGNWGGVNFVGESSDNDSEFLEARSSNRTNQFSSKIEGKDSICNGGEVVKFKKLRNGKLESTILDDENLKSGDRLSEFGASRISRNGLLGNGKFKKSKADKEFEIEASHVEFGKNLMKESEIEQAEFGYKKCNSSKRRKGLDLIDSELGVNYEKKSKFECGTCNKAFHTYQALGGHRASHKKLKGCFASKIDGSENNIHNNFISPNPTADTTKLIKTCSSNNNFPIDHGMVAKKTETNNGAKKNKGSHECPICFRVFSSGQALGGHKRSHLIVSSEAKSNQSTTILPQKPIPEIRDFLDLNMPAPVEEESSTDHVGFKPWWVGSNHKHDPLVGLISN